MRSLQQEQEMSGSALPPRLGGSNRLVCVDVSPPPNQQKPGWRKFLSYLGSGFLVSMAYIDPGNLETDLQAGANHGFELLWVVLRRIGFCSHNPVAHCKSWCKHWQASIRAMQG
ncbi:hypothetical protein L1049_025716 [Liquidambar formosana]|uniref:Natural resistance-associated macrophage protein 1 n=1 Tax=Liquidambar formosana TaxID=63359 RepID=A0AAP0NE59_LIQFO